MAETRGDAILLNIDYLFKPTSKTVFLIVCFMARFQEGPGRLVLRSGSFPDFRQSAARRAPDLRAYRPTRWP